MGSRSLGSEEHRQPTREGNLAKRLEAQREGRLFAQRWLETRFGPLAPDHVGVFAVGQGLVALGVGEQPTHRRHELLRREHAEVLGILLAGVLVGIAAAGSESDGVDASLIAGFPVGFLLSAALGGLLIHVSGQRDAKVRIAGPLACGCLGGLAIFGLVVFFFFAVFPSL